jgi:N-acetylglucosamine kinase-like BadF-type ATPase
VVMTGHGATAGVLAIDAGNSKTDVAVVAADGRVLASARGEGFRPDVVGAEAAVAGLAPLVFEAASLAGLSGTEGPYVHHVSACMANADFPVEERRLERAIDARGWARSSSVVNDTFALLRVGDTTRGRVAVICGAGINCTAMLPDGRTVRFAAVGHISGDWGGGGHLWQEAMWWAARAEDGRGPDTGLRRALPAAMGRRTMGELIEAIHLGEVSSARCHELTPVLFDVAETGDPIAVEIVHHQAEEVVALASTAIRRLGLADVPVEVLLGGGVLTAGQPQLMQWIDELLHDAAPWATTRVVKAPPILGAALLGLDKIGATPEAAARLRASYPEAESAEPTSSEPDTAVLGP